MTDPRYTDPRLSDPVLRDDSGTGVWGWIAGLAVLALVAFIVIAAWNSDKNTAGNPPPTTTSSAPMRNDAMPPSTTGSGLTTPRPMPLLPTSPANRGQQ